MLAMMFVEMIKSFIFRTENKSKINAYEKKIENLELKSKNQFNNNKSKYFFNSDVTSYKKK